MARSGIQPNPPRHVVAMPYPGRGHINPMLNLCKAVAENSAAGDILITVVVTEEWLGLLGSTEKPENVRFAAIPNVVPSEHVRGDDLNGFVMAVLTNMGEPFDRLLDKLSLPAVIIADALLPWATEVAGRRNIPVAHLWTMSASVYTVFYHFDLLVQNGHFPVELSVNGDAVVDYIPGLPQTRVRDLPVVVRDKEITPIFMKILPQESNSKYLIFTSIYGLESQVLDALKQKSGFSIYNIGPATSYVKLKDMYNPSTFSSSHEDDHERSVGYLRWLDLQPLGSILYVSLGSFLSVSRAQMDEIASGLCRSGVRFLWVARPGTSQLQEMCGEKGLVVPWCDQLRVLSHPSVGGFWSHCGWNSTKEAVLTGVPMLTSPILMDQVPNAKAVVEDWKIGWRVLREFDEENLAMGDGIAELVRRFMDLEDPEREELTKTAGKLKNTSEREFGSGESFQTNIDGFVQSILKNSS